MAKHCFGLMLVTGALFPLAALAGESETQKQTGPELPPMPKGFDGQRENIARGKVETVAYHSKTTGTRRTMAVYTPPGYSKDNAYPILYLLHGARYNENSWVHDGGAANIILDNLHSDRRIVPMVVVMPNGHVQAAVGEEKGARGFESELLNDVMPTAESRYSIRRDADHRALAGFSMGGGQSLTISLKHLDQFAWVAGFSPAIPGKANLVPSPEDGKKIKLLYLACGDADPFFGAINDFHASLEKSRVQHVWNAFPGGKHDFKVWKNDLYQFAQLLFRDESSKR